jgi:hypothetical protein
MPQYHSIRATAKNIMVSQTQGFIHGGNGVKGMKTELKFVDEGKNKQIFHISMEFVSYSPFIYFELLN